VFNLTLSKAGLLDAKSVTVAGVETVNITTADTQAVPTNPLDTLTLVATSATKVVVSGNAGLNLTNTDTTLTTVDASGITAGSFTWTSGILAAASTVQGSAAGTNTVDLTASVAGATTYTGGTGADVIVVTNAKANTFTLGAGNNTINTLGAAGTGNNTVTAGAGTDTVKFTTGNNTVDLGAGTNVFNATTGKNTYTGGAGADTILVTTGNNTVTAGDGANSFTASTGNNTYTGGTGVDTVTVGTSGSTVGTNTITTGTGADVIWIKGTVVNGNSYSVITDAAVGDTIKLDGTNGTSTFVTTKLSLASTAAFQDYLDAATAGTGAVNSAEAWFQFGGNTYIVTDNSAASTFQNGADSVVQLTGSVTVNGFTGAGGSATFLLA
jgi:S-layer protein